MNRTNNKFKNWSDTSPIVDSGKPNPCYHFKACGRVAEVEKEGKGLCRSCAAFHRGQEFPLSFAPKEFRLRYMDYTQKIHGAIQAVVGEMERDVASY